MNKLFTIKNKDDSSLSDKAFIKLNLKVGCVSNKCLIELLALQTLEAFKNGEMLARKPDMDFIMRLSLTDQIKLAEEKCAGDDVWLFIYNGFDILKCTEFTENELETAEQAALLSIK